MTRCHRQAESTMPSVAITWFFYSRGRLASAQAAVQAAQESRTTLFVGIAIGAVALCRKAVAQAATPQAAQAARLGYS